MNILEKLDRCALSDQEIAMVWLGQAGFVFMDRNGTKVAVDPYLSHCGETIKNFIRMSPILISPSDFDVDVYLITHKHFDHFDYDGIPVVAENEKVRFYGPQSCVEEFSKLGLKRKQMTLLAEDEVQVAKNVRVKPTYADHGELEPFAIGMMVSFGGMKVYITGDTAFRPEEMTDLRSSEPDIMVASVNGEFGNLTPYTGGELAAYTEAKTYIPCHFWTFREHKGRPDQVEAGLDQAGAKATPYFLTPGEIYLCTKEQNGIMNITRIANIEEKTYETKVEAI